MRIQHNIAAMNSYRNYGNNVKAVNKNLEKLSSGYKVNRAGDDAAGLAISEKMRAQIKGLEAAQKNVKDGISLVKTGEGAMQEIQDMLNRMDYLATQSANGTYDNEVDRANLQKEVQSLKSEINRIADSANFNGIKLLDGSLSGRSQAVNVTVGNTTAVKGKYTASQIGDTDALTDLKSSDIGKGIDYTVTWKDAAGNEQIHTMRLTFQGNGTGAIDDTNLDNNYFTNANGEKIMLTAAGELQGTDVGAQLIASLNADKAFADAFQVSGTDTPVFEARQDGTAGAQIVGFGIKVDAGMTKDKEDIYATASDNTITVTNAPLDSLHKINVVSGIQAADANDDTAEEIAKKVFEIDGHKFLLAGTGFTANSHTAIDDDVTVIDVSGASAAQNADADKIANEIARVTGLKVAGYTAAGPTGSGINAGDIVFTEGRLNLSGKALTLQIGDTADKFNQMDVKIGDMHTNALGINTIDISDQDGAAAAIQKIKDAINTVSSVRGDLGAIQNRLDHTANNLSVMAENIQDAESTIRDTDVADEMMSYTKNNILIQSAQAMLAQANQIPQGVLQLLG